METKETFTCEPKNLSLSEKALSLYKADVKVNGMPYNAPYKLYEGGIMYKVHIRREPKTDKSYLEIIRPVSVVSTVSL